MNKIRIGNVSRNDLDFINKRYMFEPDEEILHITTTWKSANIINLREYNALDGEEHIFTASAIGTFAEPLAQAMACEDPETFFKDFPAPPVLRLKVGTQIIILINENNYVNGTLAKITSIGKNLIIAKDKEKEYRLARHIFEDQKYELKSYGGLELKTEHLLPDKYM